MSKNKEELEINKMLNILRIFVIAFNFLVCVSFVFLPNWVWKDTSSAVLTIFAGLYSMDQIQDCIVKIIKLWK